MSKVIEITDLSKAYRLGEINTGTLSQDLSRKWALIRGKEDPFLKIGETNDRVVKGESNIVWALKDINFQIEAGDAVGIIGKNGSGKSTLLKLLSQITSPSKGTIKIKGRVASLLEVGTGFHPELSGRENIFLNGAILGMRKKEIEKKFDEIVDFSGVERYIDTPVKRYSSGMYVRLAFAVTAHLESEILIVDEVLAVGDAEFQKKSLSKLDSINSKQQKTVLFVSHNTLLIQNLCKKAILLENGIMKNFGEVHTVLAKYEEKVDLNKLVWKGKEGDEKISIIKTSLNDNFVNKEVKIDQPLQIKITVEVVKKIEIFDFGFAIYSSFSYPILRAVFNDYNDLMGIDVGVYDVVFEIPPFTLASGIYRIHFLVGYPYIKKIETDNCDLRFEVIADSEIGNRYFASDAPLFNSIIRPNCFKEIVKLD